MIRSTLIYLPAFILPRVAALVIILVGTRLLAPSEFGYFSLAVLIGEFADTVLTNWARIGFARFGAQAGGVSRAFALRMAGLMFVTTIVAIITSFAIAAGLAPERVFDVGLATGCYIASAAFLRFGIRLNQVAGRNKTASSLEAMRAATYLALTLGTMAADPNNFLAASLAGCAAGVFVGAIACRSGLAQTRSDLGDIADWRTMLAFSWPLIALALLGQLVTSLDKAMLKTVYDAATLGNYVAVFTVGRAAFDVIGASFNTEAFVKLSALFNENKKEAASRILAQQLALILSVFLPGAAMLIALIDKISLVLFKPELLPVFTSVTWIIMIGAIAINIKFYVYDNIYHLSLKNIRQIPTLVVGCAVSICIGLLVVPNAPNYGAAIMFTCGSVASLLMSIVLSRGLIAVPVLRSSILCSVIVAAISYCAISILKHEVLYGKPDWLPLFSLCIIGSMFVVISLLICYRSLGPHHPSAPAPRRYAFLANRLNHGGIERVVLSLCNGISERDIDITLILRLKEGQYLAELSPKVRVIELGHASMARCFPRLLWILLRERFDVVVCGGDQQTIAASIINLIPFQKTRYIVTAHNDPILTRYATKTAKTKMARLLRSMLFPRVSHIVTVSEGLREPLIQKFGCHPDRTTTIYNPIPVRQIQQRSTEIVSHTWLVEHDVPVILSVGRLNIAKDFLSLIRAFAIVRELRPAKLLIIGDGPERPSLEAEIRKLGLDDDIDLPGFSDNPYAYMSKADVFVLSSQWEGFAIVVAEALACGQKVIATNCPSGPAEILDDGAYGQLVPVAEPTSMAEAIIDMLDSPCARDRLQARAAQFSVEIAVDRYLALMESK